MTADTVGGVWTYALELARALEPRGTVVGLATMGAPLSADQRAEVEAAPNVTLFESAYRLEWMESPWDDVERAGEWLLDLEDRFAPDVVHLNGYAHGALPWRAPTLVVGHSCVLSWWRAVRGESAPAADWAAYREAVASGLRAADYVAAPTGAMLAALREHYGPLPRARAVPNGRDPRRFRPAEKEPFVLSAGRLWDEAKNLAALARAAEGLPWPVCVAGEDCHPDGGGRTSAGSNVRTLGCLAPDALAGWMSRAAVYALPARYEPFGLSALEAALSGCALVLGDVESLREVWGDAALYVPPGDAGALAETLNRVIRERELRETLSVAARERATRYTPERMVEGYASIYRHLLRTESHANRLLLSLASV